MIDHNPTLEELRDYAKENPDKVFDLDSSTECLAAQYADTPMFGFQRIGDLYRVPKEFSDFTATFVWTTQSSVPYNIHGYPTGRSLASAIDKLILGRDPSLVALELVQEKLACTLSGPISQPA